jgi:hypothetical protein
MDYSLERKKLNKPATPNGRVVVAPRISPAPAKPTTPTAVNKIVAPVPVKVTGGAARKPEGKKYTEADIQELLSEGYIGVHPSLWDYIPTGSHIRYVKKDVAKAGLSREERFKPGGFIRNHFTTDQGKKMLMIETKPGGKAGQFGYVSFPVAYEDIEELWKKYDRNAFVEIHLISMSLAQKKKQIEELNERVKKLEAALLRR